MTVVQRDQPPVQSLTSRRPEAPRPGSSITERCLYLAEVVTSPHGTRYSAYHIATWAAREGYDRISPPHIYKVWNGERVPSLARIKPLAGFYCAPIEFFTHDPPPDFDPAKAKTEIYLRDPQLRQFIKDIEGLPPPPRSGVEKLITNLVAGYRVEAADPAEGHRLELITNAARLSAAHRDAVAQLIESLRGT